MDKALAQGLGALSIDHSQVVRDQLVAYLQLLAKWNKVYNLTAIRDPQDMVVLHVLDSLSVKSAIKGHWVADIGAGAGLPGLPLAILCPQVQFVEVESSQKKSRFMQQVVLELGLDNVQVECQRVENYHPSRLFDTVLSRAFASVTDMLHLSGHLCGSNGVILAMKGKAPQQELSTLPNGYQFVSLSKLQVPGLEAERHLVHIQLTGSDENRE